MSIANLITAPTTGLIPYLNTALNADWSQFQVRRFSSPTQGFRLLDDSVDVYGRLGTSRKVSQRIVLGYMLTVDNAAPDDSQVIAAQFRDALDTHILEWAARYMRSHDVGQISGSVNLQQAAGQASDRQGAWIITAARRFEVGYVIDP